MLLLHRVFTRFSTNSASIKCHIRFFSHQSWSHRCLLSRHRSESLFTSLCSRFVWSESGSILKAVRDVTQTQRVHRNVLFSVSQTSRGLSRGCAVAFRLKPDISAVILGRPAVHLLELLYSLRHSVFTANRFSTFKTLWLALIDINGFEMVFSCTGIGSRFYL